MSGMVFCRACGAEIHSTAPTCPRCGAPQQAVRPASISYGFGDSIALCFNRYVQFSGRAPRAEYWYFALFYILVSIGATLLDVTVLREFRVASTLVALALALPSISVFVRRMHDRDRSGWWFWLYFVPLVGAIILFIWTVSRGTPGPNRFGPDPLAL